MPACACAGTKCHLHPLLKSATEHLHKRIGKCSNLLRYNPLSGVSFQRCCCLMSGPRLPSKTSHRWKETPLVSSPLEGSPTVARSCLNFVLSHCPKSSQFCPFHHLPLRELSCALIAREKEMSTGQKGFSLL